VNAAALLNDLAGRGILLVPKDDSLIARPKELLTDRDRAAIRQSKQLLLAQLRTIAAEVEIDRPASSDGRPKENPATEIERVARLDQERNERDRLAGRGYDYDCTAPGHNDYLRRTGAPCACLNPKEVTRHPGPQIDPALQADLTRIEPEALRLGFSHTRLFGTRFWPIEARGLAALIDRNDHLTVEEDHIVINHRDGNRSRFRRR
jgi:hypothetical protein